MWLCHPGPRELGSVREGVLPPLTRQQHIQGSKPVDCITRCDKLCPVLEHHLAVGSDWAGDGGDGTAGLHRSDHQQQGHHGGSKFYQLALTELNTDTHHTSSQYTILVVVVFLSEAVLGLMSYVLQDRLEEDLGDEIMTTMLENYQQENLVKESLDKIQIEVLT